MYRSLYNGSNLISIFQTNSKLPYDMIDTCVWFILEHFQLFLNESFLMYSFLNWNFLDDFRMIYQSRKQHKNAIDSLNLDPIKNKHFWSVI